jgi:hypothetical protein
VAQWLRHCATNRKVAGLIPDGFTEFFHWRNPTGRTMALGVDSASNRNENQEYFLGVKATGARGWQLCHLHVLIVLKSGILNLLETTGPVKACNGITLPHNQAVCIFDEVIGLMEQLISTYLVIFLALSASSPMTVILHKSLVWVFRHIF